MSGLTKGFTGQFFLSSLRVPDGNSGKLYLILREWISGGYIKERVINVQDMKYLLGVSDKYSDFKDFNKLFFKKSASKLIEKTEFTQIKLEVVEKIARKTHKIKISYDFEI